jgi:hypothetical protein
MLTLVKRLSLRLSGKLAVVLHMLHSKALAQKTARQMVFRGQKTHSRCVNQDARKRQGDLTVKFPGTATVILFSYLNAVSADSPALPLPEITASQQVTG